MGSLFFVILFLCPYEGEWTEKFKKTDLKCVCWFAKVLAYIGYLTVSNHQGSLEYLC